MGRRGAWRHGAALLLTAWIGVGTGTAEAQSGLTSGFSLRTRAEAWDWFDAGPEGRYVFSGTLLRGWALWRGSAVSARIELAAPILLGLPDDAVAAAPAGALGLGANYFAGGTGDRHATHLFPKEAWVQLGGAEGHRVRLGRSEFADGSEVIPASATLASTKAQRISQRLLGPFGWSHVGRSFDGLQYAWGQPGWNATVLAARPTRGAFDVNGWEHLDVDLGYAALTAAGGRSDARIFALYYNDRRRLPRTDNRPAPVRLADSAGVEIVTAGAHFLHELSTSAGPIDFLAWGAIQTGEWGDDPHRGGALALEAGIQPAGAPLRPWLRAGVFRATGDDDPGDARHETFFATLPTPRIYARMPFFTTMNLEEAFGSLALRPGKVVLRADVRLLRLSEAADLWYAGGGAFEAESFGYAGRPAVRRTLATLTDLSLEWRPKTSIAVTLYGGRASGGDVIDAIYGSSAAAAFGYVEVELRR
jgi:hypothetical protein